VVRVGTVNAGTSALLVPAIRLFAASQPNVTVDVANILQADIHRRLTEGTLDAGLVNVLPGDQVPASLRATVLLRGRPAVVCRTDHPFAGQPVVTVDQLREHPFVAMREGYLMHGYTQRLFAARFPRESVATDGAENAKYLVAAGAGATVLPDYSVTDDPLHEAGVLTVRPLAGVETTITMLLLRREHSRVPAAVRGFEQVIGALAAQHPQAARAD
jgi:DNA-binding transcriptional LysR family regulator